MSAQLQFVDTAPSLTPEMLQQALQKNLKCNQGLFRRIEELKAEIEFLSAQIEDLVIGSACK